MDIQYSIIVPVYNRPDEVKELLESLSQQEYNDFELVLIEDGSSIPSKEIADQYTDKLNISYCFKENSGPSFSRNYGMEKANGNYFIFVDSDCIIPKQYLSSIDKTLQKNYTDAFGGPDAAGKGFSILQKAINYAMTSFLTTGGIRGGKKRVDKFYPRSFNMGFSKKVWNKTGGFPKTRMHPGEDMVLSIEIIRNNFATQLIEDAFVYHKRRSTFKKFFKQVYKFGFMRNVISIKYPATFKIFYIFPTLFLVFVLISAALGIFNWIFTIPLLTYLAAVCIHSSIINANILVGVVSALTSIIQLTGYGSGYLVSVIKSLLRGKKPFLKKIMG